MKLFGKIKTNGILFLFLFFALILTLLAFFKLKPIYEGMTSIPPDTTFTPFTSSDNNYLNSDSSFGVSKYEDSSATTPFGTSSPLFANSTPFVSSSTPQRTGGTSTPFRTSSTPQRTGGTSPPFGTSLTPQRTGGTSPPYGLSYSTVKECLSKSCNINGNIPEKMSDSQSECVGYCYSNFF